MATKVRSVAGTVSAAAGVAVTANADASRWCAAGAAKPVVDTSTSAVGLDISGFRRATFDFVCAKSNALYRPFKRVFAKGEPVFGKIELGFTKAEPRFAKVEPIFGKVELGFTKVELGFGKVEPVFGKVELGFGIPVLEFGKSDFKMAEFSFNATTWPLAWLPERGAGATLETAPCGSSQPLSPASSAVRPKRNGSGTGRRRLRSCGGGGQRSQALLDAGPHGRRRRQVKILEFIAQGLVEAVFFRFFHHNRK